jgi:hypothetical protein
MDMAHICILTHVIIYLVNKLLLIIINYLLLLFYLFYNVIRNIIQYHYLHIFRAIKKSILS